MARDVNGKELKVGDKVRALVDYCGTKQGGVYTVGSLKNCEGDSMGVWLENGDYMSKREIILVEYKLKEDLKLTPKLIESLDELQVGDYLKDSYNTLHEVIEIHTSAEYPIETNENCYNLRELKDMGAYKVKVEPYEMVEVEEVVEEVKPKLYELVEGEDYVKLKEGDTVKFLAGLELSVDRVDVGDTIYPYAFSKEASLCSWIYSGFLVPENIISINGVNIHEESTEKDPYAGWVEGAKVRCLQTEGGYVEGKVYYLGECKSFFSDGDFGVKSKGGMVFSIGCLTSEDTKYINKDISDYFELIKE